MRQWPVAERSASRLATVDGSACRRQNRLRPAGRREPHLGCPASTWLWPARAPLPVLVASLVPMCLPSRKPPHLLTVVAATSVASAPIAPWAARWPSPRLRRQLQGARDWAWAPNCRPSFCHRHLPRVDVRARASRSKPPQPTVPSGWMWDSRQTSHRSTVSPLPFAPASLRFRVAGHESAGTCDPLGAPS